MKMLPCLFVIFTLGFEVTLSQTGTLIRKVNRLDNQMEGIEKDLYSKVFLDARANMAENTLSTHNKLKMDAAAPAKEVVKAKKPNKKPKAPAAHPKYSVMITAALKALKDRTGSSRQVILKYILANYEVDAVKAAIHLRKALKIGVASGMLKMAKSSGKFKLGKKAKEVKKPAAHPKYSVMIAAALKALKDRTGSSRQAILKYILANYEVNVMKAAIHLRKALKIGVASGMLKMVKPSGKFKLNNNQ